MHTTQAGVSTTTTLRSGAMTPTPGALAIRHTTPARRLRPAEPVPTDWACENCEAHNPGRRRRCGDCRTTRY
jgi:hypothetical protein